MLLADALPVVRAGCKALLGEDPAISVLAEAADGRGVAERAFALQPDVVVLGDDLPDIAGIVAVIDPVVTGINLLALVGRPDAAVLGRLLRSGVPLARRALTARPVLVLVQGRVSARSPAEGSPQIGRPVMP